MKLFLEKAAINNTFFDPEPYRNAYTDSFSNEKRARESLLARYLLDELLKKNFDKNLHSLGLEKDEQGKPFFRNHRALHLSIAHSNGLVAIGLCDVPLGIDVEEFFPAQHRDLKIAFNEAEKKIVGEDALTAYRLFSQKEAIAKLKGHGFLVEPNEINTLEYQDNIVSGTLSFAERHFVYAFAFDTKLEKELVLKIEEFGRE